MRRVYANMVRRNAYTLKHEKDTREKIGILSEAAAKRSHYKTTRVL